MTDTLDNSIKTNAEGPSKASGDSGSVEQHKPSEQIAVAKHLASKEAAAGKGLGIRRIKLSPPGTA